MGKPRSSLTLQHWQPRNVYHSRVYPCPDLSCRCNQAKKLRAYFIMRLIHTWEYTSYVKFMSRLSYRALILTMEFTLQSTPLREGSFWRFKHLFSWVCRLTMWSYPYSALQHPLCYK